jgi:hypothetical protein
MLYGHIALDFAAKPLAPRIKLGHLIIGALVLSHWVLDFISHPMGMGKELPPDLPLLFGNSTRVGLGLYNSLPAALGTEFVPTLTVIGLLPLPT